MPEVAKLATLLSTHVACSSMLDSELICTLASCVKNGYRFKYRSLFKEVRVASYTISARPLEFEETGKAQF